LSIGLIGKKSGMSRLFLEDGALRQELQENDEE
jgi:hypothetical protein